MRIPMAHRILLTVLGLLWQLPAQDFSLQDPSGRVSAILSHDPRQGLAWQVSAGGIEVIRPSPVGLTIDGVDLGRDSTVTQVTTCGWDETFPRRGVQERGVFKASGLTISLVHRSGRPWQVEARATREGVALRTFVEGAGSVRVQGESTAFTLPPTSRCWYFERDNAWKLKSAAGVWRSAPLQEMATVSRMGPVQGAPIVAEVPGAGYVLLSEAALAAFSGMRLRADPAGRFTVDFTEPEGFTCPLPLRTPWRVVLCAGDLGALVANDLMEGLNPPPDPRLFQDPSWIVPGRAVWRWYWDGLGTPQQQREMLVHARDLGFEYTLIDEGWEAWAEPWQALQTLCAEAAARRIRVLVWKRYEELKDPTDGYARAAAFLDQVRNAGVSGVKIDFLNAEDLVRVQFREAMLRLCAQRRLVVLFHGVSKPTGEQRTWPNLLTVEGVRGLELNWMQEGLLPASHYAALPFTRYAVGPADFTPLTVQPAHRGDTTVGLQAASWLLFTSPLQVLAENPETLLREARWRDLVAMLRLAPAVWDETRVLEPSRIGGIAVMARRSGGTWFIAGINGGETCSLDLPMAFLGPGRWNLTLLEDGADGGQSLATRRESVTAASRLAVRIRPAGGFAGWLTAE